MFMFHPLAFPFTCHSWILRALTDLESNPVIRGGIFSIFHNIMTRELLANSFSPLSQGITRYDRNAVFCTETYYKSNKHEDGVYINEIQN